MIKISTSSLVSNIGILVKSKFISFPITVFPIISISSLVCADQNLSHPEIIKNLTKLGEKARYQKGSKTAVYSF